MSKPLGVGRATDDQLRGQDYALWLVMTVSHLLEQHSRRGASELLRWDMDGRKSRSQAPRKRYVVVARDGQVRGNAQAELFCGVICAHGCHIVHGDYRRRPFAPFEKPVGRSHAGPNETRFDDERAIGLDPDRCSG